MRINKKLFEIKDVKFLPKIFFQNSPFIRKRFTCWNNKNRTRGTIRISGTGEEERVQHFPRNDVAWQRIFLSILQRLGKQKIRQLYAADDQFAIDSRANPAVIISNPFPLLERTYTFEQGILYIGVAAELWKLARSAARQPR